MPLVNAVELEQCCAVLGVEATISAEALRKHYVQESFALIRRGAPEAEREALRAAQAALLAHIEAREQAGSAVRTAPAPAERPVPAAALHVRPPARPDG